MPRYDCLVEQVVACLGQRSELSPDAVRYARTRPQRDVSTEPRGGA